MSIKSAILGALLALFCVLPIQSASSQPGETASMTWKMRSFDRYAVELTFYSKSRNAVWPGNGKVWVLRDFEVKNFKISCVPGERICYGAWQAGNSAKYWGVGKGGKGGCKSCCYTCVNGSTTTTFDLNER